MIVAKLWMLGILIMMAAFGIVAFVGYRLAAKNNDNATPTNQDH